MFERIVLAVDGWDQAKGAASAAFDHRVIEQADCPVVVVGVAAIEGRGERRAATAA